MSQPELASNASKLQLRKALIQMRLELHRQQLRHESLSVVKPFQEARQFSQQCTALLGKNSTAVLTAGTLATLALALLQRKKLANWLTLGAALAPLLGQLLRRASSEPTPAPGTGTGTTEDTQVR
ncbi:MAG: hypothetical protein K2Y25_12415 [Pseudomonadaceae bacterium]|jgi:hypothetical protein|nr:hypothetical protein [Pseudomonadaceae bacterium]